MIGDFNDFGVCCRYRGDVYRYSKLILLDAACHKPLSQVVLQFLPDELTRGTAYGRENKALNTAVTHQSFSMI